MEEQSIVAPAGREWDHVKKHSFTQNEDTVQVTFTSRASMHSLFLMPEIVDHLLSFLEEDPIDALFFCEFLTNSFQTRVAMKSKLGLDFDYHPTPSYVNWLQRVSSFRDYQTLNRGNLKPIEAPTYAYDFTKVDPNAKFYEKRCELLGLPCFFRLFSEHWINLWKKNKPAPTETDALGWRNLKERGVDYFFYRFGEILGVFNININVGSNPIDFMMGDNKQSKRVRGWNCVDCLTMLDMDEAAYGYEGVPTDVMNVVANYRQQNPGVRLYEGSNPATKQMDRDYEDVCSGNYVRFPFNSRPRVNPKLRNVVKRCMTCIHRRWKLIDMYDAWGLIEENFRDVEEWQIEIPNGLLVRRMLPDSSGNMRSGLGEGEVNIPREQHIGIRGPGRYIAAITGRFLGAPKRYGAVDETAPQTVDTRFTTYSRQDIRKFSFIMRLLTLLPVRNFYVSHAFYAARLGFTDFKQIDNQSWPAYFNPFPLDISLARSSGSSYTGFHRRGRYYATGKQSYYSNISRGHSMTYFHEEDVRWIIESAKYFIGVEKPREICLSKWWSEWMERVLSKFFPPGVSDIFPGKSLLYTLDSSPQNELLQGGFNIPFSSDADSTHKHFKYLAWFGCSGSMNPDLAFWSEYNPSIVELPLTAFTPDVSHHLLVSRLIQTELRDKLYVPGVYVNEKEAEDNKLFRRHLKYYDIYMGRVEGGGWQKRIAKMLAKPLQEGRYIEILSLSDAFKRDLTSWVSKLKTKVPDLNAMRKDTTLSLQRFIERNGKKIELLTLQMGEHKVKALPNSLWKAQLARIDYFAYRSGCLINWDKEDYQKIPWERVKREYSDILFQSRVHNDLLELKREQKEESKRKRKQERKELKKNLKRVKLSISGDEGEEGAGDICNEIIDYMEKNKELCLLLGVTKEEEEEEEEEEEDGDDVLRE